MATSKDKKKPKPITREEVEGLGHGELAKVATKRRIVASLPSSATSKASPAKPEIPEGLSPRQKTRREMSAAIAREQARVEGRNDGDES
jgi:hypothetical protein